jgi:hypothetical protein
MDNFKDGLKFGAGAYLGWILIKWGVLITIVAVGSCAVFTYALGPQRKSTEVAISKVEKALDFNIISPKMGLKVGDELAYKKSCPVRSRPSDRAKRVATAKARMVFRVKARRGKWRMIQLPNGTVGWTGCKGML